MELNIQMDLTLIEDGVAWFEHEESGFTADLPAIYTVNNRIFKFSSTCETRFLYNDVQGYHVVSRNDNDNNILVLFLTKTDVGYEIVETFILNINQRKLS